MPPPSQIPSPKIKLSQAQTIIEISDNDHNDEKVNENRSQPTKTKVFEKFIAQRQISMPPASQILSKKIKPSQTQTIIDLTDDDADDFIQSTSSFSYRPIKKLKST
jgi:hypothetical protein